MPTTPDHLKNNMVALPPHPLLTQPPPPTSKDPIEDYLLSKALLPTSVKAPTALLKALTSPKDWLAEAVYISRPLVYGKLAYLLRLMTFRLRLSQRFYSIAAWVARPTAR